MASFACLKSTPPHVLAHEPRSGATASSGIGADSQASCNTVAAVAGLDGVHVKHVFAGASHSAVISGT